jgi:5-hydroxyisourate hydrolase-like protein (transthyretin family)
MPRTIAIVSFGLLALAVLAPPKNIAAAPPAGKWKIGGIVVDASDGSPLPHTPVALAPAARRDELHTIFTGDDGRFLFENLNPGKYTLTAQRKSYLTEAFDEHGPYSTSIAVGPKLRSENLVFRLHRDASISGRVTEDGTETVRQAKVMLFQEAISNGERSIEFRADEYTNDEGTYYFNHLPPGKYFVVVSVKPWYARKPKTSTDTGEGKEIATKYEESHGSALNVAYPITYYPGSPDAEAAAPIVLSAGDRFTAAFDLHAFPAQQVHIPFGDFEPDSSLYAYISEHLLGYGRVKPQQEAMPIDGDARTPTDKKEEWVFISGVMKLEPAGSLSGPGQVVFRSKQSGKRFSQQISAQGRFQLSVPAGSYDVSAVAGAFFLMSVASSTLRVEGQMVEIVPGDDVPKLTLILTQDVGRVDGVTLKSDTPVAGAMIVLVPEDAVHHAQSFRCSQSDSDGTFTLAPVVPGKYTILAIQDGWELEWANPEVLKPYLAQGLVIQVEPKGKYEVKVKIQQLAIAANKTGK